MHRRVDILEAAANLEHLLVRVEVGEEIVITESGRPVARLVSIDTSPVDRAPGSAKGMIRMSADFDAPLPGAVLGEFGA